jgi:HD superfamily phosphohydrolase
MELAGAAQYNKGKVIHDPVWGTCEYEAWEAGLLERTVFQRLRGLRQTGFAYLTYPTAEHSRFQHTLGVAEAAGRIFNAVVERPERGGLSPRGVAERENHPLFSTTTTVETKRRWRMLVRLAALVHDTGHSVFSHSSERIYSLIPPLPQLAEALGTGNSKTPGAAEVIVYLMVTTKDWQESVAGFWNGSDIDPPSPEEWERIGRWVMGQEEDRQLKFLSDIISGPLDADKLDYVFRDGYAAGIPVGYDLERLVATISVDPQDAATGGAPWWRLTIPIHGINALEQLIMGRLVLNSYLYHHQKCRACEAAFERGLAREYLETGAVLGKASVWELFALQDADAYSYRMGNSAASREIRQLYGRRLRVRIVEFRRSDLDQSQRVTIGYMQLLEYARVRDWDGYKRLLELEDEIASKAGLEPGSVIIDVPKNPDYADLQNLMIPGKRIEAGEAPDRVLAYRDWIEAYKTHRAFVRVFGPRGEFEEAIWRASHDVFRARFSFELTPTSRIEH